MNANVTLGSYTANNHALEGQGGYSLLKVKNDTDDTYIDVDASTAAQAVIKLVAAGGDGQILIDSNDTHGLEVRLRQVTVCVNNVTKYALVLMSEPQDAPIL